MAERDTTLAVLPIGYGDGVRRGLTNNADVLIGGVRRALRGTVSMDNLTVDVGDAAGVRLGEEAILIGVDGGERIAAEELARRLGTINYEITYRAHGARATRLSPRRKAGLSEALTATRAALAGEPAWLVGGAVRDRLLGRDT